QRPARRHVAHLPHDDRRRRRGRHDRRAAAAAHPARPDRPRSRREPAVAGELTDPHDAAAARVAASSVVPRPPHNGGMRLANARLLDGTLADLDIVDGEIERVSPAGSTPAVGQRRDLEGATVVPGLWDEHTHLGQWARHRTRVSVLDAETADEAATIAARAATTHRGTDPLVLTGMRD